MYSVYDELCVFDGYDKIIDDERKDEFDFTPKQTDGKIIIKNFLKKIEYLGDEYKLIADMTGFFKKYNFIFNKILKMPRFLNDRSVAEDDIESCIMIWDYIVYDRFSNEELMFILDCLR